MQADLRPTLRRALAHKMVCCLATPAAEGRAQGASEAEALMKAERPRVRLNRRQQAALHAWLALRQEGAKQD